jgi:hypothetical protein
MGADLRMNGESSHFWTPLHKAVFFAILGGSFWYVGSRAETIWTLGGLVPPDERLPPTTGRSHAPG